jgi:hypothetical protein
MFVGFTQQQPGLVSPITDNASNKPSNFKVWK